MNFNAVFNTIYEHYHLDMYHYDMVSLFLDTISSSYEIPRNKLDKFEYLIDEPVNSVDVDEAVNSVDDDEAVDDEPNVNECVFVPSSGKNKGVQCCQPVKKGLTTCAKHASKEPHPRTEVTSNELTCTFTPSSGKNKGIKCNQTAKQGTTMCNKHSKYTKTTTENQPAEVTTCSFIPSSGKNKGIQCNQTTKQGTTICNKHSKCTKRASKSPELVSHQDEEVNCTFVPSTGKNKGVQCSHSVKHGLNTCAKHVKYAKNSSKSHQDSKTPEDTSEITTTCAFIPSTGKNKGIKCNQSTKGFETCSKHSAKNATKKANDSDSDDVVKVYSRKIPKW